jgi:predicted Zn finger-like uncharacterized protein
MRIVCPACEAEYEVPEAIGGAGRKVRCARCQTVWVASAVMPAPAPPEPVPAPPAERVPPPLVADPPPRARSEWGRVDYPLTYDEAPAAEAGLRRLAPWIGAWVVSLVVLGVAGWAGYHWRADVIRLWPASERLYAVLGPKGH